MIAFIASAGIVVWNSIVLVDLISAAAMARIFEAYHCEYAMLLDMNALEHTYPAVCRRSGSQMFVDHLLKGMSVLEKSSSGEVVPRFLGYADNRDFFYVMRKP